ncbi:hypothetical protein SODALDRAFT_77547 [Sodiomyces alkalinus F11]|uniref:N-acetyltransferase domain-containing protein n=1 Tax=Sodiomyces alkalinus (strain CBS 110278 / VKM F-3762 / F11) TaxID=1314773 RepID=A0A3N2PKN9_SODAK|nr:hypothetical protein SODALDRAFT_77547 [Sodiomyces alkalinus F11]ROT35091.1 hypothetical protein SODALDRAFT_77547 [Sodiomyces alkalinus F11]
MRRTSSSLQGPCPLVQMVPTRQVTSCAWPMNGATAVNMKCHLMPWDPESDEHVERLIQQRIACGWNAERVASEWKDEQLAGQKSIFWIVLSPDDPDFDTRLSRHIAKYPSEKLPLKDTGQSTFVPRTAREPKLASFVPVGHISLAKDDPAARDLDLDLPSAGVMWIKAMYVSDALQNGGLGRAAMDAAEGMASRPPLNARVLVLDTVQKDDQLREDYALAMYGRVAKMSNEEWYARRGYRVLKVVPGYYGDVPDRYGRHWMEIRTTFMCRDLGS